MFPPHDCLPYRAAPGDPVDSLPKARPPSRMLTTTPDGPNHLLPEQPAADLSETRRRRQAKEEMVPGKERRAPKDAVQGIVFHFAPLLREDRLGLLLIRICGYCHFFKAENKNEQAGYAGN